MKIFKNLALLIAFTILFSCQYNTRSIGDAQKSAIDSQNKLITSFKYKCGQELTAIDYPYYYGGSYINLNNQLVVLICGDTNVYKQSIVNILDCSSVIFEECRYSYKELLSIIEHLDKVEAANTIKTDDSLEYIYQLSVQDNRVIVKIVDITLSKMLRFKQTIYDSPAIAFEDCPPFPMAE